MSKTAAKRHYRRAGLISTLLTLALSPVLPTMANTPAPLLPALKTCGQGEVRVLGGLFHLADASLFLADCAQTETAARADHPKVYRIQAVRVLEGQRVADGAIKLLERNLGRAGKPGSNASFDCMNQNYPTMNPGDSLEVQYQPGDGLSLWLNGDLAKHCPSGPEGADYFVIWLGEEPLSEDLKRDLTGAAAD